MPELLLELLSEEIPARMQARAADDLRRLVTDALVEAGCLYESAQGFATPRRLTLTVEGMAARQPDTREERKGPRVNAPEKAVEGFLAAVGMTLDRLETKPDRKGEFYVATIERAGRPTPEVIADIVPRVIRDFPWPKSMRWGEGSLRWVRPLHSVLCTFDGEPVGFEIDGIRSGATTRGHRFMAPAEIAVRRFEDYEHALGKAHVMLDPARRAATIDADARNLAFAAGLELVEDDGLLREVAGLVEWPVVLMGAFDEAFLDVPEEVLVSAMRTHQKYFTVRDPGSGRLAARFVMVSNLVAADGGTAITAGNERVLRARLSDAKFFWDQDRRASLESRLPKLNEIIFHARLGTVHDKAHMMARLAMGLALAVEGADRTDCETAALLAKTDLVTEMVGEFPELQGVMGRYYALHDGLAPHVAAAIGDHYAPQGPTDAVPTESTAIVVALADKLHMLVGFFAIDEKPTGSKDPYALRRAALGVIRIVLENAIRLPLNRWFAATAEIYRELVPALVEEHWSKEAKLADAESYDNRALLAFFADRLKVHLRDKGARHDLIDAVFALGDQDDLLLMVRRVEALGRFLDSQDGANLLVGVKRAANILRIEEKKDGVSHDGEPDPDLFAQAEEKALAAAIGAAGPAAAKAVNAEDFEAAMTALAALRAPVDAFFDAVTVNAEEADLRRNRLRLLSRIRAATARVADFSRIEG